MSPRRVFETSGSSHESLSSDFETQALQPRSTTSGFFPGVCRKSYLTSAGLNSSNASKYSPSHPLSLERRIDEHPSVALVHDAALFVRLALS